MTTPPVNHMQRLNENKLKDKEYIIILGKTWGAAKMFYENTNLKDFRKAQVLFLRNKDDITFKMVKDNTIAIELPRSLDNVYNVLALKKCREKNIEVIFHDIA